MTNITDREALRVKLNSETAQINWVELQRFFAKGVVIAVNPLDDLVEVAVNIIENDQDAVQQLIDADKIKHVSDEDAMQWHAKNVSLWCVTAPPWVLVQHK